MRCMRSPDFSRGVITVAFSQGWWVGGWWLVGLRPGAIHIGTSTATPKATSQFAKLHADHGSHYLAATFAGHPDHAAAGKLMSFVAGEPAIIERSRPVLDAYTAKLLVLGDKPALAASFKLVVNFFAACLLETMGEKFTFAEKQGLNLETVASMIKEVLQHPATAQVCRENSHPQL